VCSRGETEFVCSRGETEFLKKIAAKILFSNRLVCWLVGCLVGWLVG
jgi:hypothetical protein